MNDFDELYEYYSEFDVDDDPIDAIIEGVNNDNKEGLADYLGLLLSEIEDMIEFKYSLVDQKISDIEIIKSVQKKFNVDLTDVEEDFLSIW